MIFLANRANLDTRRLLTRLHTWLQTQATTEDAPVEQVWYQTSAGNKLGVRATLTAPRFLGTTYPVEEVELHVSFDVPPNRPYDFYTVQWLRRSASSCSDGIRMRHTWISASATSNSITRERQSSGSPRRSSMCIR